MIEPNPDFRFGYIILAAISGAITSLAFMNWRQMDRVAIILNLFVGFSFAIFVAPWIAHSLIGIDLDDARGVSMITYTAASGAHSILPLIIRWVSNLIGTKA